MGFPINKVRGFFPADFRPKDVRIRNATVFSFGNLPFSKGYLITSGNFMDFCHKSIKLSVDKNRLKMVSTFPSMLIFNE